MKTRQRTSRPVEHRPLSSYLLVAAMVLPCSSGPALARDEVASSDKISSIILAHQQQKIRPAGLTVEAHEARLKVLGLDADNLDSEQCAISVQERLSEREVEALEQQGINFKKTKK